MRQRLHISPLKLRGLSLLLPRERKSGPEQQTRTFTWWCQGSDCPVFEYGLTPPRRRMVPRPRILASTAFLLEGRTRPCFVFLSAVLALVLAGCLLSVPSLTATSSGLIPTVAPLLLSGVWSIIFLAVFGNLQYKEACCRRLHS